MARGELCICNVYVRDIDFVSDVLRTNYKVLGFIQIKFEEIGFHPLLNIFQTCSKNVVFIDAIIRRTWAKR